MKHVAVFGDVHGHLRLMFELCRRWQWHHKVHLDAVLQCGDLGFFPDPGKMDGATRKYAKRDREEAGFSSYFALPAPAEKDNRLERTLRGPTDSLETVRCRVFWCHGNHEDFNSLGHAAANGISTPLDVFGVLHYLHSGRVATVAGARIAAVGGGPELTDEETAGPSDENPSKYVTPSCCDSLLEEPIDVLLTHCAPQGLCHSERSDPGSELLRCIDELRQPVYHLFAHHRRPFPLSTIGTTKCYWLNDVSFERRLGGMVPYGKLHKGCMGILYWDGPDCHRFEIVCEPWQEEMTWSNWCH